MVCDNLKMAARNEDWDDFLRYFWNQSNGNDLIKQLNEYARQNNWSDRIRREKYSPHIYGIVLNDFRIPEGSVAPHWKLVKVGFTQKSIQRGSNNRMEQLERKLRRKGFDPSTLFVLPIGSLDTNLFRDTEGRIRKKVGRPLKKEKAIEFKLPAPKEWAVTTQEHINEILQKMEDKKREHLEDVIDAFKDIRAPIRLPRECQNWVE